MPTVPRLQLTHGQVALAICEGSAPDRQTLDTMRYLRQLGIPFTEDETGIGRGNRLTYTFDHLVECAIAMWAIRRGAKPRVVAGRLVGQRKRLRKLARDQFRAMPDGALDTEWVKSRGRIHTTMADEEFIRLQPPDTSAGTLDVMTMEEVMTFKASLGDVVERHANEVHALVPLRRVMLMAVAWALVAPVTPPGRTPVVKGQH